MADMSIDELAESFELLGDWESRYGYLIDLGKQLPAMDEADKCEAHKVHGCQAQVWMKFVLGDAGRQDRMATWILSCCHQGTRPLEYPCRRADQPDRKPLATKRFVQARVRLVPIPCIQLRGDQGIPVTGPLRFHLRGKIHLPITINEPCIDGLARQVDNTGGSRDLELCSHRNDTPAANQYRPFLNRLSWRDDNPRTGEGMQVRGVFLESLQRPGGRFTMADGGHRGDQQEHNPARQSHDSSFRFLGNQAVAGQEKSAGPVDRLV